MLMTPSIFGRDLFDDFFDRSFTQPFAHVRHSVNEMMKTDIKDTSQGYDISINLPGVKKEDVKAELKNGYLTVQASSDSEQESQDETEKYICRERYFGSCSRTFYIGDHVTEEDIKAKFENGVLHMQIPKKEELPKAEEKRFIAIEG